MEWNADRLHRAVRIRGHYISPKYFRGSLFGIAVGFCDSGPLSHFSVRFLHCARLQTVPIPLRPSNLIYPALPLPRYFVIPHNCTAVSTSRRTPPGPGGRTVCRVGLRLLRLRPGSEAACWPWWARPGCAADAGLKRDLQRFV